jgi:hypothetical protein
VVARQLTLKSRLLSADHIAMDSSEIAELTERVQAAREVLTLACEAQAPDDYDEQERLEQGCQCAAVAAPCNWCTSASEAVCDAHDSLCAAESALSRARIAARPPAPPRIRYVAETTVRCEGSRANPFAYWFGAQVVSEPCIEQATWRMRSGGKVEHYCDNCNRHLQLGETREPIMRGDGRDEQRLREAKRQGWSPLSCAERIRDKAETFALACTQTADGVDPHAARKENVMFVAAVEDIARRHRRA